MKAKRLLFLVMAICLASGVKAQFYDSADDIYFYYDQNHSNSLYEVLVLNFDGKKGYWWYQSVSEVKNKLKENPNYYEDETETADYSRVKYASSTATTVTYTIYFGSDNLKTEWKISRDRKALTEYKYNKNNQIVEKNYYKLVDKSFFKIGRSRTPSGTLYE